MQLSRFHICVLAAFLTGICTFWIVPPEFSMHVFVSGIVLTLVFGVLANIGTENDKPIPPVLGAMSFLFLGTNRPGATVKKGIFFKLFMASVAFVVGAGGTVMVYMAIAN